MVFDRHLANGELSAMISVAEDVCGKERVNAMLNQMGYSHETLGRGTREFRQEGWEEEQSLESGSEESGWDLGEGSSSLKSGKAIEDDKGL